MGVDLAFALRQMVRQKTFTITVLATLGLGVGANTAIFSMVYGVLLRPLPYPTADRLVRVSEVHPGGTPLVRAPMLSNLTFDAWREARTLEGLAAYSTRDATVVHAGNPERLAGASVSPALFPLLGARAAIGRALVDGDARPGAADAIVLAHGLWTDRFAGDPSVLGTAVTLDGRPHTIVGVMPAGFYFPDRRARFWTPYTMVRPGEDAERPWRIFSAVGRLRPGASPGDAAAEGTAVARQAGPRPMVADLLFGKGAPVEVRVRPLLDEMTDRVRPALLVLLGGVGLVLLIACANVANLLLSRGVSRRRELAVRAAIGAGAGRLARQLLTEALVLAAAGGLVGVAVGWMLARAIPALAPADFPRLADVRMDGAALAFAVVVSLASGLLAGLMPALRLWRGAPLADLREGAGASGGRQTRRLGAALLVLEAAVAVMLVVVAGLLGRSFVTLLAVDPGYDTRGVLTAQVHLQPGDEARAAAIADAMLDRVRALPGVAAAGVANMAPFAPMSALMQVSLEGDSAEPIAARVRSYVVTPQYAEALSLRLRAGRLFEPADLGSAVRPLIVNEAFVRAHLADGRPAVGRRFQNPSWGEAPVEIVGVVGNVLKDGLDTAPQAEMYSLPRPPFGFPSFFTLVVRTPGDPLALVPALRQAVRETSPAAAMDRVETLGSRLSISLAEPRFATAVLAGFAVLALTLAAVGLYGVLSYQVMQRRREMGVRAALGATRRSIVGLVLREGVAVAGLGIALGLGGAFWLSGLMQGLLFGITPYDPLAYGLAPAALTLVALAAASIPALRAASTDPSETLRE